MSERTSLDTVCASLCEVMGIDKPENANEPCSELVNYAAKVFGSAKADRIFMYNPDAIAEWIYRKYPNLTTAMTARTDFELPLDCVMPSVTPVCFGTMYTGAQPDIHGIKGYKKPVIQIDTIFDALIRSGKKPVIIAQTESSLAKIYLERDMDYFIYDTVEEIHAKTAELIMADEYDFYVVYNDTYDTIMHRYGPESTEALAALYANSQGFAALSVLIENNWKQHNTLVGFAMDHGCHEIDGGCGSHGLDMEEDIQIVHRYKAYAKTE